MNTVSLSTYRPRVGLPEAVLLVLCVLISIASAWLGWISGLALAAVIALPAAMLVSSMVFGITGTIIVASAVVCFLLMNRIDEGVVLNFGVVSLKASYWLIMGAAVAIAATNLLRLGMADRFERRRRGISRQFLFWTFFFAVVLLAGALYNHTEEVPVVVRDVPGEFLACLSILAPMLFVPLILHAPYHRPHLVLTVAAIVGLGGLAGLIMASFGFLPGSVIDALGWASANQGTAGLLRGRLPLGHPNAVAAVIILLLPIAVILGLVPGGRHFRTIYLGCAMFMFAGVLFSLSRSALLVTCAILGLTTIYIYMGRGRKTLTTYMLPVFFLFGLAGVMTYLLLSFDFSRFWSRGYYEEATLERRENSMSTAVAVFLDYPILGITPDALYTRLELRPGWEPAMQDNISPIFYYKTRLTAETPHNLFLTVLAETGILGTLCLLGMFYTVFRNLWVLRRHPGLSDEQRHAIMAFILGLLGFLMMGMFEALLMVGLRTAFLFWCMAGLGLRYALDVVAAADNDAAIRIPVDQPAAAE